MRHRACRPARLAVIFCCWIPIGARAQSSAAPSAPPGQTAVTSAAIVDVRGDLVQPTTLEDWTRRWRTAVRSIDGYQWVEPKATVTGLQLILDCTALDAKCWALIGQRMGVDVMFTARVQGTHVTPGGLPDSYDVTYQRIETASGNVENQQSMVLDVAGRRKTFVAHGVDFVRGQGATAGAAPAPVAAPAAVPPVVVAAEPVATAQAEPPQSSPDPSLQLSTQSPAARATGSRLGWQTWTLLGTTLALVGGAVAMGTAANSAESDLNSPGLDCMTTADYSTCRDLRDRADRRALIANILFGAAGAAAIATGIVFYFDVSDGGTSGMAVNF